MTFLNNATKIIYLVLFVIAPACKATPITNLCITGRVEKILPSYKNNFINAVNLSLQQHSVSKKVVVKDFFYDNTPLAALYAYDRMIENKCQAIIGFEYLSDLMLIEKFQKNYDIPILTSYASSRDAHLNSQKWI